MNRTNELSAALDDLTAAAKAVSECSEKMAGAVAAIKEIFSGGLGEHHVVSEEKPAETAISEPESLPSYSFTDVRKAFAAKSHAGYTEQVKALITGYGAAKLSDVKEEDYPALMADLEGIR